LIAGRQHAVSTEGARQESAFRQSHERRVTLVPSGIGFSRTANADTLPVRDLRRRALDDGVAWKYCRRAARPPHLFVTPHPVDSAASRAVIAASGTGQCLHPNGTPADRCQVGTDYAELRPRPSSTERAGTGRERMADQLELDHGGQNRTIELMPRMPLVIATDPPRWHRRSLCLPVVRDYDEAIAWFTDKLDSPCRR
jgi:hypothetical protein